MKYITKPVLLLSQICITASCVTSPTRNDNNDRITKDNASNNYTINLSATDSQTGKVLDIERSLVLLEASPSGLFLEFNEETNSKLSKIAFSGQTPPRSLEVFVFVQGYYPLGKTLQIPGAMSREELLKNIELKALFRLKKCSSCFSKLAEPDQEAKFQKVMTAAKAQLKLGRVDRSIDVLKKAQPANIEQHATLYFHTARSRHRAGRSYQTRGSSDDLNETIHANYFAYLLEPKKITAIYNEVAHTHDESKADILLDFIFNKTQNDDTQRQLISKLIMTDKDLEWYRTRNDYANKLARWDQGAKSIELCYPDFDTEDTATNLSGRCKPKNGVCPGQFKLEKTVHPLQENEKCMKNSVSCG